MHGSPSFEVVRQFGGSGEPRRLPGGEGRTWLVENTVFKQVEPRYATFEAEIVRELRQVGYRLATPVLSTSGDWTVDGWAAYTFVSGHFTKGENVEDRFVSSRSFHEELIQFSYSEHLDKQSDPWSVAQRNAFGKQSWDVSPRLGDLLETLGNLDRAPRDSWQIIHADIAGNFLFEAGLAPAIIDLTFKWSPSGLAEAVMAVDIVLWENVPLEKVFPLLRPSESELIPLATRRRLLEIDTLHRLGGRPDAIFEQVPRYEEFVRLYSATLKG